MTTFDIEMEPLTVFEVGDECLFIQYSDNQALFEDLLKYYNDEAYRFEVPASEFGAVANRLEEAYFEPTVVTELEPYCVLIEKYDNHAEILKHSVATWERDGKRFFLMKDELAVKDAIERGAMPTSKMDSVVGL